MAKEEELYVVFDQEQGIIQIKVPLDKAEEIASGLSGNIKLIKMDEYDPEKSYFDQGYYPDQEKEGS